MKLAAGILCTLPLIVFSQIGGEIAYQSLAVANNARSAALGGNTISLADGDISQFFGNPAALDSVASGDVFFDVNPFFADATFYSFAYSFRIGGIQNLAAGLHYLNFGSFELIDDRGNELGSFSAADYTAFLSMAHQMGPFTFGTSLKYLNNTVASYARSAIALDFGGVFRVSPGWTIAMVFENMGVQVTSDAALSKAKLPFDVRLGTSFKPKHMPLRFTITTNSITNSSFISLEDDQGRSNEIIDKALRKLNLGAEILLNKHVQFLIGYNHKRKKELQLADTRG